MHKNVFRNDCPKSVLLASLALFLAGCGVVVGGEPSTDADSDGFSDAEEMMAGSDSNNALSTPNDIDADGVANDMDEDRDGDGLLDSWEETYGLGYSSISDATGINGPDGDPDSDGYDNMAEHDASSDPNNAASTPDDIDGDGFTNATEMMAGSNPNNALSTPDDIDGDGFTNAAEIMAGSNPNLAASIPDDIDGDSFTNAAEMMAGSNPNNALSTPDDIDGDGFTNAAEMTAGSDPNNALSTPNDIDADGFTNAAEMTAGSDPNNALSTPNDIDADGFTNAAEMTAGSDPNNALSTPNDIDADGLPDAWESMYGLDPNDNGDIDNGGTDVNNGPDGDLDSDGFTNAAEYIAGSYPNLAASTPDDRDGDGLPDAWESMYDLDPNDNGDIDNGGTDVNNGPDGDLDGDTFTNLAEYTAGSYPDLAASTPDDIDGDGFTNAADTNPRLFDRTLIVANNIDDTASVNAGDAGFTLRGAAASDQLGYSVSGAGDVNGDGIDDVIVGARYNDAGSSNAGAAYVIYGTDDGSHMDVNVGSLTASQGFRILGAAPSDYLGYSVSAAGDVNGDGYDDLIAGAHGVNGASIDVGAAYVIYGQTGKTRGNIDFGDTTSFSASVGFRILGAAASDAFGQSVSDAGDVNGDGIDDLIVGARYNDVGGTAAGAAYVIYGTDDEGKTRGNIEIADFSASDYDGADGFRILGAFPGNWLGDAVSGAGDVNGDGIADLIVGARSINFSAGAAYVIYGQDSTVENYVDRGDLNVSNLSASAGFTINGVAANDNLGISLSGAGDVNGDGIDDLIVGANGVSNNTGAAYVIYGQDSTVENYVDRGVLNVSAFAGTDYNGADGFRILGAMSGDSLGISVSGAGDVNGDGIADLIAGANQADSDDGTLSNTGAAYVIYGQDSTVENYVDRGDLNVSAFAGTDYNGADGFRLLGAAAADQLGFSVSSAGDVNGDGFDDLIAGAISVSNNTGAAYVLLSPTPVPEPPAGSN